MSTSWKAVGLEQAKSNPLYGVRGWLLVFAAALLLGVFADVGFALRSAREASITAGELLDLDAPAVLFLKRILLFEAIRLVVYFMLLTKSRAFRVGATLLVVAQVPIFVLLPVAEPVAGLGLFETVQTIVSSLLSCAVWTVYLNRSRRVRVTFEHTLRADSQAKVGADQGIPGGSARPVAASAEVLSSGRPMSTAEGVDSYTQESHEPTDAHWSLALSELNSAERQPGLWARSFSRAGGVESAAQAAYLEARAHQLHLAANERLRQRLAEEAFQDRLIEQRGRLESNIGAAAGLVQHVMLNGRATIGSAISIIRLLDGTAEWKGAGALSLKPAWQVQFDGDSHQFDTDKLLCDWVYVDGLRAAQTLLEARGVEISAFDISAAICPNCSIKVSPRAAGCLECRAEFGPGSNWKPLPA